MMDSLGKIESLDPRKVWEHEASRFTPWLRDNIARLAETLHLDLELAESEVPVGDFSLDIFGKRCGVEAFGDNRESA